MNLRHRHFISIFVFNFSLLFSGCLTAKSVDINISVSHAVYLTYQKWTQNTSCAQIDTFSGDFVPRSAIELVIFCKALQASGLEYKLNIIESGNYSRNLWLLINQGFHSVGETVWRKEAENIAVYISEPIFAKNEFEKALFTTRNHALLSIPPTRLAKQLKHFVGITPQHWIYDWQALEKITPIRVDAPNQISIHRMLLAKRADFCFGEFSHSMNFQFEDMSLVNLPGVKIVFPDSRHFIIAKQAPNAKVIFEALNKGIVILKKQNVIDKIWVNTGVINPLAKKWLTLNQ